MIYLIYQQFFNGLGFGKDTEINLDLEDGS